MDKKTYVVDRLEGDMAVLVGNDNDEVLTVRISRLPEGAAEGDCLRCKEGELTLDRDETEARLERARELFERLTGKDKNSR